MDVKTGYSRMYNTGTDKQSLQVSKLSNRTPFQLILGKPMNIQLLGPIPTLPLKHYVLREGRE